MIKPLDDERTRISEILALGYAGDRSRRLRPEEARKRDVLPGIVEEVVRLVGRKTAPLVVDAAAGRAPIGLVLAERLAPKSPRIVAIERDPARLDAARQAFERVLGSTDALSTAAGDVGDPAHWPAGPDVVVAMHACGSATDDILTQAAACSARHVLVVPCCVAASLRFAVEADALAEGLGLDRGELRRRFRDVYTLARRVLVLESLGYVTETVAICSPSVTPYNLALRGRRDPEPVRMRRAREALSSTPVVTRA